MAGLREKKAKRTKARILEVTAELVTERGFADTSLEAIASQAEVAVGTVYNYFGSKGNLLVELMNHEITPLLEEADELVQSPGEDPVLAIKRMARLWSTMFDKFDKERWREMFSIVFSKERKLTDAMFRLDMEAVMQIQALFEGFARRGQVRADLDAGEAAMMIYGLLILQAIMWSVEDDLTTEDLRSGMDRQIDMVFRGLEVKK
ncbi:MAG: TetR/AcrR family transcriptional regulator [Deltaproteobacteria bacterium]|nr:TetR/AcrR family transcriptional regulator [Deltaproteobacteria bacterium]